MELTHAEEVRARVTPDPRVAPREIGGEVLDDAVAPLGARDLAANVLAELPVVGDQLRVHALIRATAGRFDKRDNFGEPCVSADDDRLFCTLRCERPHLENGGLRAQGALLRGSMHLQRALEVAEGGEEAVVEEAIGKEGEARLDAWAESEPPPEPPPRTARPSEDVQDRGEPERIHIVRKQAVSPFQITAVDSTAAGDAFVAAFLLAEAKGEPPDQCARLANAAGAYQASRPGSADVLPTRAELRAFLAGRGAPDERGSLG